MLCQVKSSFVHLIVLKLLLLIMDLSIQNNNKRFKYLMYDIILYYKIQKDKS